jgi:hypothetical protein
MRQSLFDQPSIVVAGSRYDTLGSPVDAALRSLAPLVRVTPVPAPAGVRGWLTLLRHASPAIRAGAEGLHLLDPSLAPAALLLRARYGVPVTATADGAPRELTRVQRRLLGRIDELLVHGMPAWDGRADHRIGRLLHGLPAARFVIGVPWTRDAAKMRWFRDAVAPLLHGDPVCLVLGAPGGRQARLLAGALGLQHRLRVHTGRLDADVLAAASRYVDAFVLLDDPRAPVGARDLALALTASGAPVVAAAGMADAVLEHERNAIVADGRNGMALAAALNNLLALPAIQRHYLGADFRARTLDRWSWSAAAEVYARRFAVIVGRPQVPVELRAA